MNVGTSAEDWIGAAVFNNAVWCDAVCRALGCDTDFVDGMWINLSPSPPFYSNAITLTHDGSVAQLRHVERLAGVGLPSEWSVKDAFKTLELAPLGFRMLFEAHWLRLPADRTPDATETPGVRWVRLTTEPELAAWEAAWRSAPANALPELSDPARIFVPELLDDPDVAFLAARRDDRIVAVVVGNRSDDGSGPVGGVSNIVLPAEDVAAHRRGAIAAVGAAFPDLPLVCYDRGADLAAMRVLGFEQLGPLRVWVRS
jgi:hypothetical protein